MTGGQRRFRIAALAVSAVILLGVGVIAGPQRPREAAAQSTPPWTVTASPVTEIGDGTKITVTLTTPPGTELDQAVAQVCRAGVGYQTGTGKRPPADFALGGPNCPPTPISSSSDLTRTDSTLGDASAPGGTTLDLLAGQGRVEWTDSTGTPQSLQCDPEHPCVLVVEVRGLVDGVRTWVPWVQQLGYLTTDAIAGCGGPADGIVGSASSDRMSDAWVRWTLDQCRSGNQAGAATGASYPGEGAAVDAYERGDVDLLYSAVGADPSVGLVGPDGGTRPSAVVPVGLNATVLAIGNGWPQGADKQSYTDIELTLDEVTELIAAGPTFLAPATRDAILARNPQLQASGLFVASSSTMKVGAGAGAEATSWFATDYLHTLRPDTFRVPAVGSFNDDAGKQRGVDAALAVASPSYANVLDLFTGRPVLDKTVKSLGFEAQTYGGVWALTDLVTARALGLTVVRIQNAAGQYVTPTPESMAAAVAGMTETDSGVLLPDPSNTAPVGGVTPYPLTFVEYAFAPTTPLVDASCVLRTSSQGLLTDWLTYVTGPGQDRLPPGMEPVPAGLAAGTDEAIASIGTAELPCTPPPAPPDPTAPSPEAGTGAPLGGGAPPASGGNELASGSIGGGTGGSVGAGGSITDPGAPADITDVVADAELAAATADLPDFAGRSAASTAMAALAMVAVLAGLTVASLASSGRLRRPRWGRSRP